MKPLKIALIGCGKQAPKHISGLRKIPGIELVLADLDRELARQLGEKESVEYVDSVEDVFRRSDIDAVDICTPTQSHIGLIRSAIDTGKNFFCEKPLCESLEEAREIEAHAVQKNCTGMVGFVYRFLPVYEMAHQLLSSSHADGHSTVLGQLASAHFRLGGRGSHQAWKHRRETGGGAINEMLVHMVDLALWFFGPVERVETLDCRLLRPQRKIRGEIVDANAEDYVLIRLHMKNGMQVYCQSDLVTPAFTQFMEVQGDNGSFMGSIQNDMPSFIFCQEGVAGYESGKTAFDFGYRNYFEAQMAEFVNAVREGRMPSRCTLADSVQLIETMEKIDRSLTS